MSLTKVVKPFDGAEDTEVVEKEDEGGGVVGKKAGMEEEESDVKV